MKNPLIDEMRSTSVYKLLSSIADIPAAARTSAMGGRDVGREASPLNASAFGLSAEAR